MKLLRTFTGVLLLAAPLFSQLPSLSDPRIESGGLVWFELGITRAGVVKALGNPFTVAESGDFLSLQYQIGAVDHDDVSHQIVFRKSTSALVSVTRNYEPERSVDALFPESATTTHHYPGPAAARFSVRIRRLPDGRLLLAMGVSGPGQPTGQIVMIRESELRHFYPWLDEQLRSTSGHKPRSSTQAALP